jgi:hypothetical protein
LPKLSQRHRKTRSNVDGGRLGSLGIEQAWRASQSFL